MASQDASRQRGGASNKDGTSGNNIRVAAVHHTTKRAWETANLEWETEKAEWEKEKAGWKKEKADLQREMRQLQVENKYLKLILDDLHKSIIVGEATLQIELKPPEDIKNDTLLIELTANTKQIHIKFYELETKLDYIHRTISQLTSMIVGGDRSTDPTQEKTNKFTATGRQPKRNPANTFEQREQSSQIDKDIEDVTSAWKHLKEKEIDLSASKQEMASKIQEYEQNYEKLRAEHQNLETSFSALSERYKKANAEKGALLADKQNLDADIKRLQDEMKALKQSEEKNKSLNEKLKKLEEQVEALQKENNEVKYRLKESQSPSLISNISANDNKTVQQLKVENEHLLSRLSELAGAQMTPNNPNIADRSDSFRPTKLSEEYSQLYDNLWTDAFEEHSGKKEEEDVIKMLRKGLLGSYEFCENVCRAFTVQLTNSSLALPNSKPKKGLQDIPIVYKKQLQDMKKSFGVFLRNDVKESYRKQNTIEGGDKTKNYIDACVELCWLMVIQEPPVVIETPASKDSAFDTNTYRTYTKTGKKVDFVVWPALRLHQGGPLLTKGVAQGKN